MSRARGFAFLGALLSSTLLPLQAFSQETAANVAATYSALAECTAAVKSFNESASSLNSLCQDWESSGLKEIFGNALPCQANLSSCLIYQEDAVRSGCLDAEPTAETCQSFMSSTNEASKCSIVQRMSASERSQVERGLDQSIRDLIRERTEVDKQTEDLVTSLTKEAKDLQEREAEIQQEIALLKADLEAVGPESQATIQKAYNDYVTALESLDLEMEKAVSKFQADQIERNKLKTEAMAGCQKMASDLFVAEQQQRQAMNAARRNSTPLNSLTGNAQKFRANLNKYIHECEQSEIHQASLKHIENVFSVAKQQYENLQKRVARMRQHLTTNFERTQQSMQQSVQMQVKSLMEKMAALESQIQKARMAAAQNVMLTQQQQQAKKGSIDSIEAQLQELNSTKTTYACMDKCAKHIQPPGIGKSAEDFQAMLDKRREGKTRCQELRTICTLAGRGDIRAPGCGPAGDLIESEWNATH